MKANFGWNPDILLGMLSSVIENNTTNLEKMNVIFRGMSDVIESLNDEIIDLKKQNDKHIAYIRSLEEEKVIPMSNDMLQDYKPEDY